MLTFLFAAVRMSFLPPTYRFLPIATAARWRMTSRLAECRDIDIQRIYRSHRASKAAEWMSLDTEQPRQRGQRSYTVCRYRHVPECVCI